MRRQDAHNGARVRHIWSDDEGAHGVVINQGLGRMVLVAWDDRTIPEPEDTINLTLIHPMLIHPIELAQRMMTEGLDTPTGFGHPRRVPMSLVRLALKHDFPVQQHSDASS